MDSLKSFGNSRFLGSIFTFDMHEKYKSFRDNR